MSENRAGYNRSDHIYSADVERDEEETDTDTEVTPDPPSQDHEYYSSPERERSSPRFRLVNTSIMTRFCGGCGLPVCYTQTVKL